MDSNFLDRLFEVLLYTPPIVPYLAAFLILVACGLGLPIPEDITLFVMGYLSYNQITDFNISVVVCFVGVLLGDTVIYAVGWKYGESLTKRKFFAKLLPPERMEKTREMFHRMGNKVIFAARFMPGLRAPTYFSAGALRLPFKVFFFYDVLASLLSVPLLIGVTYYFGDKIEAAIQVAREIQHGIIFVIVGLILLFVLKHYVMKRRQAKAAK